jgi:hypothetical protein
VDTPADLLREALERAMPRLMDLDEERSRTPRAPGKWSPREVIGHLVDSAVNNQVRFVRGQLEEDLVFPGYDQEAWVRVQRYAALAWPDLITLWHHLNLHVVRTMEAASPEVRRRPRARHNLDEIGWRPFPREKPATLDDLMRDYVGHLEHHLGQIPGIR